MKNRLLREFIRESLKGTDDVLLNEQRMYRPVKYFSLNQFSRTILKEFEAKGRQITPDDLPVPEEVQNDMESYKTELDSFLRKHEDKISRATDYYQNLGPSSAGAGPLIKEVMLAAAKLDMKYVSSRSQYPAAVAIVAYKITQAWDNIPQMVYSFISPMLKRGWNWVTSFFTENYDYVRWSDKKLLSEEFKFRDPTGRSVTSPDGYEGDYESVEEPAAAPEPAAVGLDTATVADVATTGAMLSATRGTRAAPPPAATSPASPPPAERAPSATRAPAGRLRRVTRLPAPAPAVARSAPAAAKAGKGVLGSLLGLVGFGDAATITGGTAATGAVAAGETAAVGTGLTLGWIIAGIAASIAMAFVVMAFWDSMLSPWMASDADFKPIKEMKDKLQGSSAANLKEIADWFDAEDERMAEALRTVAQSIAEEELSTTTLDGLINACKDVES